jgi:phosphotriesterase-related protein
MVRTVLGDISDDALGVTMCHEHFIVDLDKVRQDGESKIETIEEVEPEIRKMMALGAQSAVEVSTIDIGRDVKKLKKISEDTGLNIIAATGFYLQPFHPAWLSDASIEQITDLFVKELTEGIEDTGIKAGIIGEIPASSKGLTKDERKVLIASGNASCITGAAITTHTNRTNAMELIDILLGLGVDPDKVIIGHQDLTDDVEFHLSLLRRGVNIAFDTCGKWSYMPDERRAANACAIIQAGYQDHLVLSNDVSRRSYFTCYGKLGYTGALGNVVPMMKKMGATKEDLEGILIRNPARILNNESWR